MVVLCLAAHGTIVPMVNPDLVAAVGLVTGGAIAVRGVQYYSCAKDCKTLTQYIMQDLAMLRGTDKFSILMPAEENDLRQSLKETIQQEQLFRTLFCKKDDTKSSTSHGQITRRARWCCR